MAADELVPVKSHLWFIIKLALTEQFAVSGHDDTSSDLRVRTHLRQLKKCAILMLPCCCCYPVWPPRRLLRAEGLLRAAR